MKANHFQQNALLEVIPLPKKPAFCGDDYIIFAVVFCFVQSQLLCSSGEEGASYDPVNSNQTRLIVVHVQI